MSEKGSTSKTSKNSRPGRMANVLCPGGIHKNGMMYMNVYDIQGINGLAKIDRKTPYFMEKSMVSCRFSL